jgi:hypothetical protein
MFYRKKRRMHTLTKLFAYMFFSHLLYKEKEERVEKKIERKKRGVDS